MKIQIKNWYNGSAIFETNAETIGHAIIAAMAAKANLHSANLRSANLHSADLRSANLHGADLRDADLSGANLHGADLSGANLRSANLHGADLRDADLRDANLHGANLSGANLIDADLERLISVRTILPDGDLIVWKKLQDGAICKLKIPSEAKRVGGLIGRKCRAEFAVVLEGEGVSIHDGKTRYKAGERITPDKFDPDPLSECSNGIHFYITKQEAEEHY